MTEKEANEYLFSFGVNSLNRFECFLKIAIRLDRETYWRVLRDAYTMSDDLFNFRNQVKDAFSKPKISRNKLLTKSELNKFTNLPRLVKIYRGMTVEELESGNFGVSWTLSKRTANFFANVYERNHSTRNNQKIVLCFIVEKKNLIALFDDRKEKEIIYIHDLNNFHYENSLHK